MNLWALLPKIQIKAVLFYAILNFSDFGLCYYNLWASVIMTLIFFSKTSWWSTKHFHNGKKKNQILLKKKSKRLESRVVSRVIASLTYQLSLCCLSLCGKKIGVLVIFWKFFFEGILNAWFNVSLIFNNNEERLVE